MRCCSLLLLLCLPAAALAVDPPAMALLNTGYGMVYATQSGVVVDQGDGNYALRTTSGGVQVDTAAYGPSPFGVPQLTTALAAKVGQSFALNGPICVRSGGGRLVIAVAYDGAPASWSMPVYDMQMLVVDEGGDKFAAQVTNQGNLMTWPIYFHSTTMATAKPAVVANAGQVITARCSLLVRGNPIDNNHRAVVVYKVNP